MARLTWDDIGEHFYETGIKDVALYVWDDTLPSAKDFTKANTFASDTIYYVRDQYMTYSVASPQPTSETFSAGTYYTKATTNSGNYATGVAWNGITAVNETPTGAEATDLFADDKKYLSLLSAEELEGTVEAYTYPDEWEECDGSANPGNLGVKFGQQSRKQFCLSYVTTVGNDTNGNDYGEKLHILYNGKASPSERAYSTINDSPEAITFSWSLKATKVTIGDAAKNLEVDGVKIFKDLKDTALITLESKDFGEDDTTYETIKDALQGGSNTTAHILLPDDIINIIYEKNNSQGEG